VWVLARTVDVRIAERRVGDAILDVVEVQVALHGQLRYPIWRNWILWMLLRGRKALVLAVDGSAAGGEKHTSHPVFDPILE